MVAMLRLYDTTSKLENHSRFSHVHSSIAAAAAAAVVGANRASNRTPYHTNATCNLQPVHEMTKMEHCVL